MRTRTAVWLLQVGNQRRPKSGFWRKVVAKLFWSRASCLANDLLHIQVVTLVFLLFSIDRISAADLEADAIGRGQPVGNQLFEELRQGLSFYNPFDGTPDAAFAGGEPRPLNPGMHFSFSDGLIGQGLGAKSGPNARPEYTSSGNLLAARGTVSLWFRPYARSRTEDTPQNMRWLFSSRAIKDRLYLHYAAGSLNFDYFAKTSILSWEANQWQHLTITWTSQEYNLYVNGRLAATGYAKPHWDIRAGIGDTFTVGGYRGNQTNSNGTIDEFAIWDRVLSAQEVSQLYHRGKAGLPILPAAFRRPLATARMPSHSPAHVLENGSFEAGASHWLQIEVPKAYAPSVPSFASARFTPRLTQVVETNSVHGARSLRFTLPSGNRRRSEGPPITHDYNRGTAFVSTLAFQLDPDMQYRATFWVRSKQPYSASVSLSGLRQTSQPASAMTKNVLVTNHRNVWTPVSVIGFPGKAYDDLYRMHIELRNLGDTDSDIFIDALQVEVYQPDIQGPIYRTQHAIVGTLSTERKGNVFSDDEDLMLVSTFANQTGIAASNDFSVSLYDFYDNLVFEKTLPLTLGPHKSLEVQTRIPTPLRGSFRATLVRNNTDYADEINLSRIPSLTPNKAIGAHVASDDYLLGIAKRLGIFWNRLWDNGKATAWTTVQPQKQGVFVWTYSDQMVDKSLMYGLTPIGLISWPYRWEWNWIDHTNPSWIHKKWNTRGERSLDVRLMDNPEFRAQWAEYVRGVVSHFANKIDHWEVLNEPYEKDSVDWVTNVYRLTIPIVRQANPRAKILGPSAYDRKHWLKQLVASGILPSIDIFTYHGYALSPQQLRDIGRTASTDGVRRPLFNSEDSGSTSARFFCRSCLGGVFSGKESHSKSAGLQAQGLLQSLGEGANTYIYYWIVPYDAYMPHGTFINYDGTLRSSAVAYAMAAWMLGDFVSAHPIFIGRNIRSYFYRRTDGSAVAAIWNIANSDLTLRFRKLHADTRIWDIMGNPVDSHLKSGSVILNATHPLYIEGNDSKSLEAVLGALTLRPDF